MQGQQHGGMWACDTLRGVEHADAFEGFAQIRHGWLGKMAGAALSDVPIQRAAAWVTACDAANKRTLIDEGIAGNPWHGLVLRVQLVRHECRKY
jgi:hypothetical protein